MTDEPLGTHVLELQVTDVIAETHDARSLVLAVPGAPNDRVVPAERLRYAPGQFLTLRIPSERTGSVARCYSLSSSPFAGDAMTVTVKRTVDGYASNWLCDNAYPGMRLHVLGPSGTFVPESLEDDFLLIAAGSGIVNGARISRADDRDHPNHGDLQVGAVARLWPSRCVVRQSGRELGDICRGASRVDGKVP